MTDARNAAVAAIDIGTNSTRLLKESYPDLNWVEGITLKRNPTPEDRNNVINTLKEAMPVKK